MGFYCLRASLYFHITLGIYLILKYNVQIAINAVLKFCPPKSHLYAKYYEKKKQKEKENEI
jgi:hypothetical protein